MRGVGDADSECQGKVCIYSNYSNKGLLLKGRLMLNSKKSNNLINAGLEKVLNPKHKAGNQNQNEGSREDESAS